MRVTVIIPVLNEEGSMEAALDALKTLGADEVIVVDGGSTDRTADIVARSPARIAASPLGRARQMNQGAELAQGEVLLFLHADTRLPASALVDIEAALADPLCVGGRFDVRLDNDRWIFKLIGKMISLRSRLTKVATGDQAIFVRRDIFEEIGGFPDLPLMEDIAFAG